MVSLRKIAVDEQLISSLNIGSTCHSYRFNHFKHSNVFKEKQTNMEIY